MFRRALRVLDTDLSTNEASTDDVPNENDPQTSIIEPTHITYNGERVQLPKKYPCNVNKCGHKVIASHHFDKDDWERYEKAVIPVAGVCPHCDEPVKGRRGIRKKDRMWDHTFNECHKYPYSKAFKK